MPKHQPPNPVQHHHNPDNHARQLEDRHFVARLRHARQAPRAALEAGGEGGEGFILGIRASAAGRGVGASGRRRAYRVVQHSLVARVVVDVDRDAAQGRDLGGELVEAGVVLPGERLLSARGVQAGVWELWWARGMDGSGELRPGRLRRVDVVPVWVYRRRECARGAARRELVVYVPLALVGVRHGGGDCGGSSGSRRWARSVAAQLARGACMRGLESGSRSGDNKILRFEKGERRMCVRLRRRVGRRKCTRRREGVAAGVWAGVPETGVWRAAEPQNRR